MSDQTISFTASGGPADPPRKWSKMEDYARPSQTLDENRIVIALNVGQTFGSSGVANEMTFFRYSDATLTGAKFATALLALAIPAGVLGYLLNSGPIAMVCVLMVSAAAFLLSGCAERALVERERTGLGQ